MACVKGAIDIFHNFLVEVSMVLMLAAGMWDLKEKEIPVMLLMGISSTAFLIFWNASLWDKIYDLVVMGFWVIGGRILMKRGMIGSGDVWLLSCFVWIWPVEVFWESLGNAVVILCVVAMGLLIIERNEKIQIPMVPFLVLGYWMRGI